MRMRTSNESRCAPWDVTQPSMDSGLTSRHSSHYHRDHHVNLQCCLHTSSPNTVLGPDSPTPTVHSLPPTSSTSLLRRFPLFHFYDRLRSVPSSAGVGVDCPDENRPLSEPETVTTDRFLTNRSVGTGSIFNFGFLRPSELKVFTGRIVNDCRTALMPIIRKDSFRWLMPKVSQRRLVCKNGECNISRVNIDKRGRRYLADIFTTLVDIKWRWILLVFTMAFTLSWVIFALLWWLIAFSHQDLENYGHEEWKPCVQEVFDFPTALLFSIETQQTIGYGTRCMNPNCPHAIILVMAQSCFGIIIQALMTGLVFAKLSRPKKRAQTLMFSKCAVICPRDGELYLLFRVGDMRKSHIVEAQVRAIVVSKRITEEGEVLPLYQRDLVVGGDGEAGADGKLFLVWPVIVQHRIDADSPLWDISADDLQLHTGTGSIGAAGMPGVSRTGSVGRHHFEILVVLEGIVESTGMTTQARTSYLPHEIQWGHRFERLVRFRRDEAIYVVDYARFHHTVPLDCDIPRESARVQAETAAAEETRRNNNDSGKDNCDDQAMATTTTLRSRAGGRNSSLNRRTNTEDDDVRVTDDYDGLSSRSDSPATTASRTLQLAVGVPLAHRAVTPVIGRRRPVGTLMQELSLAAFDLTDECSSLNPGPSRLSPAKTDGRRHHPSQERQQSSADAYHPTNAMTALSRALGAVALPPSSPFDLQR